MSTRSLRRGSKAGGSSKKGKEANGGEKGRVAAVQEEVGRSPTTAKQSPFSLRKCPDTLIECVGGKQVANCEQMFS